MVLKCCPSPFSHLRWLMVYCWISLTFLCSNVIAYVRILSNEGIYVILLINEVFG
jgi:hypothetical protein